MQFLSDCMDLYKTFHSVSIGRPNIRACPGLLLTLALCWVPLPKMKTSCAEPGASRDTDSGRAQCDRAAG